MTFSEHHESPRIFYELYQIHKREIEETAIAQV